MERHGRGMRLKTITLMAKRHETSWAQPSNEMLNYPETMLSQLSRNRGNGLFKTIHHGTTPTQLGVIWLLERYFIKRCVIFYSLDDFFFFLLKKEIHVPSRHSRSLVSKI